jgi:para-nitrobenzyl esterase
VKSWQGVRKAVDFGPPALQGEAFYPRDTQSEDCLTLNIWAPAEPKAGEKHPVLLWIHGGAFIQGSGAQPRYDGTELAKRGAIVVTINYRLGPLGLFAHPALSAEAGPTDALANFCLLDMIAALRWTRDNIAAFGGDPGNVTVSGSSAGGTSCLFLMGSPEARGLFHKAIIHSSGGMRNIKTLAEAEQAGAALAEQLGAGTRATAADLRRLDADDVAVSTQQIQQLGLPVKPVVDGRLVTHTPEQVFAQGQQARIPVLIGGANGESGARQFGDEVATGGAFGFQRQLADAMTRDGQKVYMFQMTFVPPQARATRSAALHGEPVAYAFGTIGMSAAAQRGFRSEGAATRAAGRRRGGGAGAGATAVGGREDDSAPVEESTEGRRISEAMMDYFVAFMRTGKPEANGLAEWPAYSASAPKTMVFGNFGIGAK